MQTETEFFHRIDMQELLDLLVEETAGSLSLLSDFMLGDSNSEDEVVHDRPGAADNVRIAFRFGFRNSNGARMGFLQLPARRRPRARRCTL